FDLCVLEHPQDRRQVPLGGDVVGDDAEVELRVAGRGGRSGGRRAYGEAGGRGGPGGLEEAAAGDGAHGGTSAGEEAGGRGTIMPAGGPIARGNRRFRAPV